jgi:AcrR family transcriptional regulator
MPADSRRPTASGEAAARDRRASPAPPRLDGEARRQQILRESMECFASHGFRGTTMRVLAQRVGLTEAALYRYFPSKESLYRAIIDRKMAAPDLVEVLAPAAQRRDDEDLFRTLAREIFRRIESDPAFLRILLYTALEGHALAEPFFASRVRRIREFVGGYIATRIAEGAFRDTDPVLAARAFLGMVFDHLNVRLVFRQQEAYPQPLDEVVGTFVGIFLGGMRRAPDGVAP